MQIYDYGLEIAAAAMAIAFGGDGCKKQARVAPRRYGGKRQFRIHGARRWELFQGFNL